MQVIASRTRAHAHKASASRLCVIECLHESYNNRLKFMNRVFTWSAGGLCMKRLAWTFLSFCLVLVLFPRSLCACCTIADSVCVRFTIPEKYPNVSMNIFIFLVLNINEYLIVLACIFDLIFSVKLMVQSYLLEICVCVTVKHSVHSNHHHFTANHFNLQC